MRFTPTWTGAGWQVRIARNGRAPLTVATMELDKDRRGVRTTLSVRLGEGLTYRDKVNLTSAHSRARVLAALAKKDITLDERALIALEEVWRTPVKPIAKAEAERSFDQAEPLDLAGLRAAFDRWLLIRDADLLPVIVGTVLAHRLGGEPVWLLLVAPPGGTKTEPLRALYGCPGMYPLSELTPKTFPSGLEVPGGQDPSLLRRLTNEILLLKDLTTVLEMRREDRQATLAQLREIYDGRYDKTWGTGRELHWEGCLGFLAGVTPIIDKHQGVMSILGERFVLFRTVLPDRKKLARQALQSSTHEREMREELARAMRGFLAGRDVRAPRADDVTLDRIAAVADFVTRARSGVQRDRSKRELEYAPEPEAPTRFAKVLLALAGGVALAYDSPTIGARELRLVLRVAVDCLPLIRHRVIAALAQTSIEAEGDALSTGHVAGAAQFSTTAIRRTLEDLQALAVITCVKGGTGKPDLWTLAPEWAEIFRSLERDAGGFGTRGDVAGTVPLDTADPHHTGPLFDIPPDLREPGEEG
jgi:hypothetical protein